MRIRDYEYIQANLPRQKTIKSDKMEKNREKSPHKRGTPSANAHKAQDDQFIKDTVEISSIKTGKTGKGSQKCGETPEKAGEASEKCEVDSEKTENTAEKTGEAADKNAKIADELQKMADELKWLKEQMEVARKQSEGEAKKWEILIKCLRIAARIMSGDIVPRGDHRYLAKHDPKLYSKALTMRIPKDHPRKHKRLSKDEKPDRAAKEGAQKDSVQKNSAVSTPTAPDAKAAEETEEQPLTGEA